MVGGNGKKEKREKNKKRKVGSLVRQAHTLAWPRSVGGWQWLPPAQGRCSLVGPSPRPSLVSDTEHVLCRVMGLGLGLRPLTLILLHLLILWGPWVGIGVCNCFLGRS